MGDESGTASFATGGGDDATTEPGALILGLGNDLVSDDGFGPAVAELCARRFEEDSRVHVESASVAGFHQIFIATQNAPSSTSE